MLFGTKFIKKPVDAYPDFELVTESFLENPAIPSAMKKTLAKAAALASHAIYISGRCKDGLLVSSKLSRPNLTLENMVSEFIVHPRQASAVRVNIQLPQPVDVDNNVFSLVTLIQQRRALASQQWATARAA